MPKNTQTKQAIRVERIERLITKYLDQFRYATEQRTEIVGYDEEKKKPEVAMPEWDAANIDGPVSQYDNFDDSNPEHCPANVGAVLDQAIRKQCSHEDSTEEVTLPYWDDQIGLTEEEIALMDDWVDYVLDLAETLSDTQIQFFADWATWLKGGKHPYTADVRKAGNLYAHKQFSTVCTLAGFGKIAFFIRPLLSRSNLALQAITKADMDRMLEEAGEALASTTETEKWEGRLNEYGHLRFDGTQVQTLPDMSQHRRSDADGNPMAYHPAVHSQWTGWQPGDGGWEELEGWDLGQGCWEDEVELPVQPNTAEALSQILEALNVEIRWNVRQKRAEMKTSGEGPDETVNTVLPSDWAPFTERNEASLQTSIEENYALTPPSPKTGSQKPWELHEMRWRKLINTLLNERNVDPFLDWLDKHAYWDGEDRIETLLTRIGAPDNELTRWASRYMLVGPIMRAYYPGCIIQEMPVLLGGQGRGKSGTIAELIPEKWRTEWHGDNVNLADPPQKQTEAIAGRALVEISEMVGSTRAEVEALKAFLTRTNDGQLRQAYARFAESSPRRCVFVGTSNNDQPLPNDPTGNRRFVVIDLSKKEATVPPLVQMQWLRNHRLVLWGEAHHKFLHAKKPDDKGKVWDGWGTAQLPPKLYGEQAAQNALYRHSDESMEAAVKQVADQFAANGGTLKDIAQSIWGGDDTVLDRREQMRLSKAMKACGWEKKRVRKEGERQHVWVPPETDIAHESEEIVAPPASESF